MGMSDIPPKQSINGTTAAQAGADFGAPFGDPRQTNLSDGNTPGALVSIHAAALHAGSDSFPVLKAFQDYLEAERQRARRRIVMLSTFFVSLMVIVVAAFLLVGIKIFGRMERTQDRLLEAALRQSVAAAQMASLPAPAPAAPAVAAVPPEMNAELRLLRDTLASLRREFAQARAPQPPAVLPVVAVPAPAAAPVAVAVPVAPAVAPIVAPAAAVAGAGKPPLEVPPAKPLTPPEGYLDGTLYVPRGNGAMPVPWRVFVPSR